MQISEANFLYTLTSIRQRLFAFLRRELSKKAIDGLAPSHGDILFVLDRKGPITMQDLARRPLKDKSTVSTVSNRLEALGYIVKEKDAADGRYANLTLTPKADRLRPVLYGISKKMNAKLFEGFTEDEKQTLFRLMEKMYRNL